MRNRSGITHILGNRRGIALLIVLLVTALLITVVFEFAYATRISVNSAVNFRDSQRAYYLSRAGISAFSRYGDQLRTIIPQGEWGVVPVISEGETEVRIKWEDQCGLINVNTSLNWVGNLLSLKGIDTSVFEKIGELKKGRTFLFVSELHSVMSDEDFNKIADFLTVDSNGQINLNTASEDVLKSIFPDKLQLVSTIINTRKDKHLSGWQDVPGLDTHTVGAVVGSLVGDSPIYRVYAYATIGGYTRQIEAVVKNNTVSFMKAL